MKKIICFSLFFAFLMSPTLLHAEPSEAMAQMSKREVLEDLALRLDPERSKTDNMKVGFIFTEPNEVYQMNILFGRANFSAGIPSDPDLILIFSDSAWKKIMNGEISVWHAVISARDPATQVHINGKTEDFERFLTLFQKDKDSPIRRYV